MQETPERKLYLLSPYRPPTSYPVTLSNEEIESWFSAYCALWHPVALSGAIQPPELASTYDHDQPQTGAVYAVVNGPNLYLAEDWFARAETAGAIAFSAATSRLETTSGMLSACKSELKLTPNVLRLFTGVAFGYLMVETLFDAMDHEHLLEVEPFWAAVQQAAVLALKGEPDSVIRPYLVEAAQKLLSAREIVASTPPKLLDFVVLQKDKLPDAWPQSLAGKVPLSLVSSGEVLQQLKETSPKLFEELIQQLPVGLPSAVDLAIGCEYDREDSLLPTESVLWNMTQGKRSSQKLLGIEPEQAGRALAVAFPQMPTYLVHAGYRHGQAVGLIGRNPFSHRSSSIHWPGLDGQSLDAFAKEPLPAQDPATFFNFAYHLHQAVSNDAVPTLAFIHTNTPAPPAYDDLLAISELSAVFGEWVNLAGFFSDTHAGEYVGPSGADDHTIDILDDRVTAQKQSNPISDFANRWRLRRETDAAYTFAALARMLADTTTQDAELLQQLDAAETVAERDGICPSIKTIQMDFATRLAQRITARGTANTPGYVVLNPCGYTRRVAVELHNEAGSIPVEGPVKASEFTNGIMRAVVEVPACGFTWIPKGKLQPASKLKVPLTENTTLRNEFLEAEIDAGTGGIRAIKDSKTRLNRLGQMLVYNPGSTMKARSVTITNSGSCLGEITSVGDIVSEHNDILATYTQHTRLWVGRPVLELKIDIKPVKPATDYPWHSYFGCRFAWRDDRASLFRGIHGATMSTHAARPGSPEFIEVRFGSLRNFVFTGGLPFAQKVGGRMLDVILSPAGEAETSFELLIALDRENPAQTAQGWISPAAVVPVNNGPPPSGVTGWLAGVDLPSLLMTSLKPERNSRAITARFLETAGFGGLSNLTFARTPSKACTVNGKGEVKNEITIQGDDVGLEFSANELFAVKAEW